MQLSGIQKIALAIGGVTALVIGMFIVIAPHAFYAGYGISMGNTPSMMSELRAPGAGLAAFGAIMISGVVRAAMAPAASVVALTVFLAFPAGRIVSLAVDGMPSSAVLGALVVEIVIAAILLVAFKPFGGHRVGGVGLADLKR